MIFTDICIESTHSNSLNLDYVIANVQTSARCSLVLLLYINSDHFLVVLNIGSLGRWVKSNLVKRSLDDQESYIG